MVLEHKDAPGKVGVQSTQLSSMIEAALTSALSQRFGASNGQAAPTDSNVVTMAQEPQNDILKSIHRWTLDPQVLPPSDAHLFVINQDRTIEAISNQEYERRTAVMGQPAIAGFVNTLDGIGGLDIPWGAVLFGALPGAIVSEVIDGLMPAHNADGSINFMNLGVKGLVAWAGVQFGPQLVGRRASQFFAGGLILFVLSDFLPIDQWVANLRGLFGRTATGGQFAAHELELARQAQTASPASTFNPSAADDALESLRNHRRRRAA